MLKRLLILVAFVLGVPVVAYATVAAIKAHDNGELQGLMLRDYPDLTPAHLQQFTVDRLCQVPDATTVEICGAYEVLNMMSIAAVWTAAVGLGLLLLIWVAGRLSRNDRTLLLVLFRPGLYLTAAALIGLVLAHGALAMGALYFGEATFVGRVHIGLLALIALGAAAGAILIARHAFAIVGATQTLAVGTEIGRTDSPELWRVVDETASQLGALAPDHAVVGLEPNFYVTEADVVCLSGTLTGRTLYCSLPLARILSKGEFASVLGHELAHFHGEDTKFSKRFYPIYRGTTASLEAVQNAGGEGASAIALLPAVAIFGYFLESFSMAESQISRERELIADRAGATVATEQDIATALVKLHAFSGIWTSLVEEAVERLRAGKYIVNTSKLFAEVAMGHATPNVLADLESMRLHHPTDSHPPLAARLQALRVPLSEVSTKALNVCPEDAAINWFDQHEELEESISVQLQLLLAKQHGIQVQDGA